ncbi:hypothetical protein CA603_51595 [Paraburkholderia hospita]|nr:hypothetical protein CA603_51595 [Paraburkholderia hospita]
MILPSFRETDEGLVATFPNDSISDRLHMRSAQLDSLMSSVVADGHFSMLSDQIQGDIMWLASTLSEEIRQLLEAQLLERMEQRERTQRANVGFADIETMSDRDLTIAAQAVLVRAREPEHA